MRLKIIKTALQASTCSFKSMGTSAHGSSKKTFAAFVKNTLKQTNFTLENIEHINMKKFCLKKIIPTLPMNHFLVISIKAKIQCQHILRTFFFIQITQILRNLKDHSQKKIPITVVTLEILQIRKTFEKNFYILFPSKNDRIASLPLGEKCWDGQGEKKRHCGQKVAGKKYMVIVESSSM